MALSSPEASPASSAVGAALRGDGQPTLISSSLSLTPQSAGFILFSRTELNPIAKSIRIDPNQFRYPAWIAYTPTERTRTPHARMHALTHTKRNNIDAAVRSGSDRIGSTRGIRTRPEWPKSAADSDGKSGDSEPGTAACALALRA